MAPSMAEVCAGYGGLYEAVREIAPIHLSWYSEIDPDANTVMINHHPHVPNHGNLAAIDWHAIEPIDILAGGIPCQPWSLSGTRNGADDPRDLWPIQKAGQNGMLTAIQILSPHIVIIENVPGLLTGNRGEAFRAILHDLTDLGYTTRWATVGACTVGLCHHRHRIFIIATRAVGELPPEIGMPISAWAAWPRDGVCHNGEVWAQPTHTCDLTHITMPTPTRSDGVGDAGSGISGGLNLRTAVTLLPTPIARDAIRASGHKTPQGRPLSEVIALLPTSQTSTTCDVFGDYATSISRHAAIVGRQAPPPTITGSRGARRLNPVFAEWMMGLPEGHITHPLAGSPSSANRLAGNGVVPRAAAHAIQKIVNRAGYGSLLDILEL